MKQLKLFEVDLPFPPNLKPGRASGRVERVHVCPQCQGVLFLTYDVEEVIYGRSSGGGWRTVRVKDCFEYACQFCKHEFKLKTPRGDCRLCNQRAECLLHGISEIITRKVFKPYSTIKPKRMTVWE